MLSKSFFFGSIIIPMYEYRCVLTKAQIELLSIDKPVTYTISEDKDKKKKFKKPNVADLFNKAEQWAEKYKDGKKPNIDLTRFKKVE
jgi:hypothetical protein